MSDQLLTVQAGQPVTITESGIPTGSMVGFQVMKALSGTITQGRTTAGVVERPAASGNFVIPFTAPVEGELYLVVVDWTGGVLAPETTRVTELQVVVGATAASPTGLGEIADWAKASLGGETWNGLIDSPNYGASYVAKAILAVKERVMTVPPATVDEGTLSVLVLSYLGKLVALQLMPAARDYWGNQTQSVSIGDDPIEIATYPNRNTMLDALKEDLVAQVVEEQAKALELLGTAVRVIASRGPMIDEDFDDARVTDDPRTFPRSDTFPYTDSEFAAIGGGVRIGSGP
jgi:hypothetical protein